MSCSEFLKISSYSVSIGGDLKDFTSKVTNVTHTNASISAAKQPARHKNIPQVGDKLLYTPLSFTSLIDHELKSYLILLKWLEDVVRKGDPVTRDVTLIAYDADNKAVVEFQYKDAFPTAVDGFSFTSTDSTDASLSFSSTFEFSDMAVNVLN